jgi:peptidoglycan hydrolase CwlO-like protein
MINIIDGVKQYTNYRKDFTPDERIAYNNYAKGRMLIYFKTDKGKAKVKEHNKKLYNKKKEQKKVNEELKKVNEELEKVNEELEKVK